MIDKSKVRSAKFEIMNEDDGISCGCMEGYNVTEKDIRQAVKDLNFEPQGNTYVELAYRILHTGIYKPFRFRGYTISLGCEYEGSLDEDVGHIVDMEHDITLSQLGVEL